MIRKVADVIRLDLITNIWNVWVSDVKPLQAPQHPDGGRQGQLVVLDRLLEKALVGAWQATKRLWWSDDQMAGVDRNAIQGEMIHVMTTTHNLSQKDNHYVFLCFLFQMMIQCVSSLFKNCTLRKTWAHPSGKHVWFLFVWAWSDGLWYIVET